MSAAKGWTWWDGGALMEGRCGPVYVKIRRRRPPEGTAGPWWHWMVRVSLDETPIECVQCRAEDRPEFIEGGGATDTRTDAKAAALAWVRGVAQVLTEAADKLEGEP